MQDWTPREHYTAEDLVEIIRILRDGENGCPWDKVQTHASIRKNFLEETCEALEAIDADDPVMMQEELGDVLMQVVFHTVIEEERGRFDMEKVCREVCEKLVFRHPNIFASSAAENAGINSWDALKNKEKGRTTLADELDTVPATLPALMRAQKLQKRAARFGCGPEDAAAFYALQNEVRAAMPHPEQFVPDTLENIARYLKEDLCIGGWDGGRLGAYFILRYCGQDAHNYAAFMGIMRKALMARLREELPIPVQGTYGYITKMRREQNDIKKSHVNDARCISKHPLAEPCSVCYRTKAIRHHNRQTHKANFSKGGIRKRSQMPYVVEGYRLWDKVLYKGQECFVSGRRASGSFTLKKLDGTRISKGVTFKKLRLLEPATNYLIERM